jgi:hypothetical protein
LLATALALGQGREAAACKSASFKAEIVAGQSFERDLSSDLTFRLAPTGLGPKGQLHGWEMSILALGRSERDYIYPVNPPLRFNGVQIFGPSYGETTKASLYYPHEVRFLLNQADYDRLSPLVTNALWPYYAPHPDQAAEEYFAVLKTMTTGRLKLTVLSYDADPETDSLRRMKFQVELAVPADFRLAEDLKPKPATCPANPE